MDQRDRDTKCREAGVVLGTLGGEPDELAGTTLMPADHEDVRLVHGHRVWLTRLETDPQRLVRATLGFVDASLEQVDARLVVCGEPQQGWLTDLDGDPAHLGARLAHPCDV